MRPEPVLDGWRPHSSLNSEGSTSVSPSLGPTPNQRIARKVLS